MGYAKDWMDLLQRYKDSTTHVFYGMHRPHSLGGIAGSLPSFWEQVCTPPQRIDTLMAVYDFYPNLTAWQEVAVKEALLLYANAAI